MKYKKFKKIEHIKFVHCNQNVDFKTKSLELAGPQKHRLVVEQVGNSYDFYSAVTKTIRTDPNVVFFLKGKEARGSPGYVVHPCPSSF